MSMAAGSVQKCGSGAPSASPELYGNDVDHFPCNQHGCAGCCSPVEMLLQPFLQAKAIGYHQVRAAHQGRFLSRDFEGVRIGVGLHECRHAGLVAEDLSCHVAQRCWW